VKVVVSSWFNASTTFGCGCGGGGFVLVSGRGVRGAYADVLSIYHIQYTIYNIPYTKHRHTKVDISRSAANEMRFSRNMKGKPRGTNKQTLWS
jgi:hypothetical protein